MSRAMFERSAKASLLLALLVSTSLVGQAFAHEDAVLESPQSAVAAGGSLALKGSDFEASTSYRLRLVGALNEYDLQAVQSGAEGEFSTDVDIPPTVRPGVYRVVAVAPDGDEVASLDMTVLQRQSPGADRAEEMPATHAEADRMAMAGSMARADEINIERSRSGAAWGLIGLVIGLAGGLGIGMLRRS